MTIVLEARATLEHLASKPHRFEAIRFVTGGIPAAALASLNAQSVRAL
jgi:hypothetical protein